MGLQGRFPRQGGSSREEHGGKLEAGRPQASPLVGEGGLPHRLRKSERLGLPFHFGAWGAPLPVNPSAPLPRSSLCAVEASPTSRPGETETQELPSAKEGGGVFRDFHSPPHPPSNAAALQKRRRTLHGCGGGCGGRGGRLHQLLQCAPPPALPGLGNHHLGLEGVLLQRLHSAQREKREAERRDQAALGPGLDTRRPAHSLWDHGGAFVAPACDD